MKIKLRVSGPGGRTFLREHGGDQFVVGRDPDCDLSFPDSDTTQGVSWRHAEIQLSPRGALLKDLGSTNGTFLDGDRVERPVRLAVGSQIRLGQAGPLLEVASLDLAVRPPAAASVPPPPVAAAPVATSAAEPPVGGTRAMLVELQKQQRTTTWVFVGLGALALMGVVVVVMLLGRGGQAVVVVDGRGTPASGGSAESTGPAADPAAAVPRRGNPSAETTASPSAPSSPPDWKQVVAPYEDALVWLGFKTASGYRLPYFTGFAVQEDRIVTTGYAGKHLQEQMQRGNEAVASCRALGEELVTIKEVRIHPRYVTQVSGQNDQVNDDEFDFNVAVVTLEKPLPVKPCELANGDALLSGLKSGTAIAAAGYDITEEHLQNGFDPLNPPSIVMLEGVMGGASMPGATTKQSRRALQLAAPDGASGGPIFDRHGKVVAILWVHKENFGVVASTAAELPE